MVPKLCGGDLEFANFSTGAEAVGGTGEDAALALLREIEGLPASGAASFAVTTKTPGSTPAIESDAPWREAESSSGSSVSLTTAANKYSAYSQDWGRKFLLNGGCFYIDLQHLEGCLPEVLSAFDHLAATHAVYRLAHAASVAANAKQPPGRRIHVLATNSDGLGNSFGSHFNLLVTRNAWENLFHRRLHYQGFLAAYEASSIIVTGLGKVGAENGAPRTAFQLSQRADFFEAVTGLQTTYRRPLLNTRDEPLCGPRYPTVELSLAALNLARLHVIFYDHNLCHAAGLLKVGVMQIILAMIESGQVDSRLLLEEPLDAVIRWSHDPTLRTRAALLAGGKVTALELQLHFHEAARRFVEAGHCEGVVPDAAMILELWGDTLAHLEARRWGPLARRLDWVLKLTLLQQTLAQQSHLGWASPEIKHLDHLYSSLDPGEGLYWACERNGLVERLVPETRIACLMSEPPTDTRAWTRATLLRLADPATVDRLDWDLLRFQVGQRPVYLTLALPDPLGATRAETNPRLPEAGDLWDALEALGATLSVETRSEDPTDSGGARLLPSRPEGDAKEGQSGLARQQLRSIKPTTAEQVQREHGTSQTSGVTSEPSPPADANTHDASNRSAGGKQTTMETTDEHG